MPSEKDLTAAGLSRSRKAIKRVSAKKKEGLSLGIESPKGRVPLIRPRRDRRVILRDPF